MSEKHCADLKQPVTKAYLFYNFMRMKSRIGKCRAWRWIGGLLGLRMKGDKGIGLERERVWGMAASEYKVLGGYD